MTEINPFLLLSMFIMLGATFLFIILAYLQNSEDLSLLAGICAAFTIFFMIACGAAWHDIHYPAAEAIKTLK